MSRWSGERKKPYTDIGLARQKCVACGEPATAQFQICADGNTYRPVCRHHDWAINAAVLGVLGHPNIRVVLARYAQRHTKGGEG